jgi:hypothetical protein
MRRISAIDWGAVIKDVSSLLGGLMTALNIGDQVPEYPIKSTNTLKGIVSNLQANFPDPTSNTGAELLRAKALQWKADADAKVQRGESVAVNQTYSLMLDDIIRLYEGYITGQHPPLPGGVLPKPGGTTNEGNEQNFPKTAGMSTGAMVGIAALAIGLLMSKKR